MNKFSMAKAALILLFATIFTRTESAAARLYFQKSNLRPEKHTPAGLPETCLTNHPANDRFASYSPDGSRIVFESDRSGNWDIFMIDSNDGNLRQITTDTTDERSPSWHPSGKKLIFESARGARSQLFTHDLKTGITEPLEIAGLPEGNQMFGRYSPDGERLAFSIQFSDTVFHLFLLENTTEKWRQLTSGNSRFTFPNWMPDGKSLVFHARYATENRTDDIYLLHLKTGKMRRLTQRPKHDFCPSVSPDGKHIAFAGAMENLHAEIFTVKKNGKGRRQITRNEFGETLPSWRPDGRALLVSAWRGNNYELCEILLD